MLSSVVLAASVLEACAGPTSMPSQAGSTLTLGTFEGILPCADCAGIRTELTLYAEQPSGRPVRYELTETYLGTRDGDRIFKKTGRWTVLRGATNDDNATVYQLDFDRPQTVQNFLKLSELELRLLDRSQNEISTQAPHSLHRISNEPARFEITLLESDAGRTIDLDPGQRVAIRLNSNPTTGYRWELAATAGVLTKLAEPIYTADAAASDAVGGGGIETWLFEASRTGREKLLFEYRRPWEREVVAARTFSYLISVR
jgi:predicted secreted protein/uncharacterized lipoprotein NlpE involved in copper resistance